MRTFWKRFLPVLIGMLILAQGALAYATLEKGDSGTAVREMQAALAALGYTVEVDGSFGTATYNAVREFQRDHQLTVDGKAGDATLTKLYALLAQLNSVQPSYAANDSVTALVYCADGGKLNLRSGAGTGYKVIEQIPTGETVLVIEKGNKWSKVTHDGNTGYVMTSFLLFDISATATPAAPVATTAPTASTDLVAAIVTCADGGKLNLRQTASSGAKVLTRIPNGTLIYGRATSSKWFLTTYNGETGYVMLSFLDFQASSATPATAVPQPTAAPTPSADWLSATVYTADGGKLNLRQTASSSAKVLDRIPAGTSLLVREVDSKWSVTTYNGQTGYVMTKYLRFSVATNAPAQTPTLAPTPTATQGVTIATVFCENGGKLNLRAGAGTSYKVLKQIPNGTVLTVVVRGSKWTCVNYLGEIGYVSNDYLIFSTATATPGVTTAPTQPGTSVGSDFRYGELRYATVKTSSGSLNLRKGPDTTYGKITEIPEGAQVVVMRVDGDWCRVYWGDYIGYVLGEYLSIQGFSGSDSVSLSYDTALLTRVLREGYTGQDVNMTQERLKELNYLATASGVYDTATIAAVKLFQGVHGLTEDGYAGPNTFAILFSAGAFPYTPSSEVYQKYVIDYRETSSEERTAAITRAQRALKELNYYAPVTGAFDENLHDAIVAFQLRNGITASGVLDAATQSRLYSGTAHDAGWEPRYSLEPDAGKLENAPTNITLKHWANEVNAMFSGVSTFMVYDPATGLQWELSVLSRGRHMDVQPTTLRDTLIMHKSFVTTSWDIHVVYALLPDGSWCMCTMHNRAHYVNTIMNNGFGGQNCVHFLRDMSEAQANDPSYGVKNQEVLREAWKKLTGETIP